MGERGREKKRDSSVGMTDKKETLQTSLAAGGLVKQSGFVQPADGSREQRVVYPSAC